MTNYACKFSYCDDVFLRRQDLKQHLSKVHGLTHPISQIQILKEWGYTDEDKLKDKTINMKITVNSLVGLVE